MKLTFLTMLVLLFLACGANPEVKFPEHGQGYVHDFSGVLNRDTVKIINAKLRAADLEGLTKMAVVTVPSLQGLTVEDYTIRLGKKWGVGDKKNDNGIILLIATTEKKLRLETGYGVEAVLPDIVCSQILTHDVKPYLKKSNMDFNKAAINGVNAVLTALSKKEK